MPMPWWQVLSLRDEIMKIEGNIDDVQMSLFRVAYPSPGDRLPYEDPRYYGSITEPTAGLVRFMGTVAIRLGGRQDYQRAPALVHLDQGMGGGKSHALVGLYHLVTSPNVMVETDVGRAAMREAATHLGGQLPDLSDVRVVTLCCDHMTPHAPNGDEDQDGPAHSLWERFLWRLVCPDYELYYRLCHRQDQSGITEALRAVGRPVLILVDEIMDYVRQLDDNRFSASRNQDLAFVRSLMDAVNDVPHVAAIFVLIASDQDPAHYDQVALHFRDEFQANVTRNGMKTAVSDAGDFAAIIRRRVFTTAPPEGEMAATAQDFLDARTEVWQTRVFDVLTDSGSWEKQVSRCYPFHPDLFGLVEGVWGKLAGYQRVRSTFSLFTRAAYVWAMRSQEGLWTPTLIGPGDLPLDDDDTQEHLLSSGVIASDALAANYRQVMTTDIADPTGKSGVATAMDRSWMHETWHRANPRAAQRMGTALLLYSLAARGGTAGATDPEIRAAAFVPDLAFRWQDAETVFNALSDPETGLGSLETIPGAGGRPRRYLMTTRQTLQMLFRARWSEAAEDPEREQLAWDIACAEANGPKGGFGNVLPIHDLPDPASRKQRAATVLFVAAGEGAERRTRLLVLDPRRWLLLNGKDDETRQDIQALFGVGGGAISSIGTATLAVACANRYRWGSQAIPKARQVLAWKRVTEAPTVAADEGLLREAQHYFGDMQKTLKVLVRSAFQHYVFLARDAADELIISFGKFEQESKTALSGLDVWNALVEGGRAVDSLEAATFSALLQGRLPRSLADLTEDFLTNPRFPMLKSTQTLQIAVFEAIRAGRIELLGRDGQPLPAPDSAENVAIHSSEQVLRWPSNADSPKGYGEDGRHGSTKRWGNIAEGGGGSRRENLGSGHAASGDDGHNEGHHPDVPAVRRATLSMRLQSGLEGAAKQTLINLFSRLATAIENGLIEGVNVNLQVDGEKEEMEVLRRAGERIEGTKPHMDDLP